MEFAWKVVLFQIPQAFLFIYAGLGLVGVRVGFRSVLLLACIIGVLAEYTRLHIFPWHTLVFVPALAVLQRYYYRLGWGASFAAVFLGFILINVGEALLALVVLPIAGWSLESVMDNLPRFLAMGWLAQVPLVAVAYGIYKWKWVLYPFDSDREGRGITAGKA